MPEAKVTLVRHNFVKTYLPEACLERSEISLLNTVQSLPVPYNSECIRGATPKTNLKRVKNDQNIKIKEPKMAKINIKEAKKAQNEEKSDREAHPKSSYLSSGRGDVPVACEDDKVSPEQNSTSTTENMPAAGIMHASVPNTKPEAPTGHFYHIYKILSIILKVLPKKQVQTVQMPLIEVICSMLCPSDRHQYRLWARKGHLLYFIFKIAPSIIACGMRSCLLPYHYPLDQSPVALESLAFILAVIISSAHIAYDTELIRPLNAHKLHKPNIMGPSRLLYHYNSNGKSFYYLSLMLVQSCICLLLAWLYDHTNGLSKNKTLHLQPILSSLHDWKRCKVFTHATGV